MILIDRCATCKFHEIVEYESIIIGNTGKEDICKQPDSQLFRQTIDDAKNFGCIFWKGTENRDCEKCRKKIHIDEIYKSWEGNKLICEICWDTIIF